MSSAFNHILVGSRVTEIRIQIPPFTSCETLDKLLVSCSLISLILGSRVITATSNTEALNESVDIKEVLSPVLGL